MGSLIETLTPAQQAFVKAVLRGENPGRAAVAAGYNSEASANYLMSRHAGVIAAIREETVRALIVEDAPLARQTLRTIMQDTAAPANARVSAAKTLLDRAGYVAPKHAEKADRKAVAELSSEELRDMIARIEGELGARATDVTPQAWDS
jgi:phage terminase small subunit